MTRAMQGLAVVALTLATAASLRAAQAGGSPPTSPQSVAPSDTGHKHGAGHKHGGGKHAAHKWLSFDAATNTVTFKLVAGRRRGPSRLNFKVDPTAKAPAWLKSK